MKRTPRPRFAALRSRLSLIILGVAIGLATRWLVSAIGGNAPPPIFDPIPADVETAGEESNRP